MDHFQDFTFVSVMYRQTHFSLGRREIWRTGGHTGWGMNDLSVCRTVLPFKLNDTEITQILAVSGSFHSLVPSWFISISFSKPQRGFKSAY